VRLAPAHAAFVLGGVSIVAASRGEGNRPTIVRATGCKIVDERVTVFVSRAAGPEFLDSVRQSGVLSVVFSQPSTHRTIQLKGAGARVGPLAAGDADLLGRYVEAFVAELASLGHPADMVRAVVTAPPEECLAVSFLPTQAFDQTPGPRAGAALER
jgi:hypothetical protein